MIDKGKTDPALGEAVQKHLIKLGIATPMASSPPGLYPPDLSSLTNAFASIMMTLGLDLDDDSLKDSPSRVAKMYLNEIFGGLDPNNFPKCTTIENKMAYDEMILERNIRVMSVCEHHFVTIHGNAHVAYIPNDRVIGLSKMNRIVEYFSRRPQVQERLTEQVFAVLSFILNTDNVAVVIDAEHFCVKMRGVEDPNSNTITSKLGGRFKVDPALRAEFMGLIK